MWEGRDGELLAWAVEQQQATAGERSSFYATSRDDDAAHIALIERCGLVRDGWHNIHLARDLGEPIPRPALPEGFTIRLLDGERDIATYVAMHRTALVLIE
jgi:mycothiol synthase